MTVFEINGQLLVVDCGVLFPEETQPGVDLILPDLNHIVDRLDDVVAVLPFVIGFAVANVVAAGGLFMGTEWAQRVAVAVSGLGIVAGSFGLFLMIAGRGPAVVASALAFMTFNFLFVEPRYTFTISDPGEWLSLLLFLLTALVTGQLAAMLRRQAQAAEQHAREMTILYDLSQALTLAVGLEPTEPFEANGRDIQIADPAAGVIKELLA